MNSKPAQMLLKILSPTINLQIADVVRMPFLYERVAEKAVVDLTESNVLISKCDWDSYETSWDFKRNPLV